MAENKFDQKLDMDQLDEVAGGAIGDRTIAALWGQVVDTSNLNGDSVNSFMANFCAKAGVDYKMNEEGMDQFKIDGEWRDAMWLAKNKQYALDYFDKKLGIK